MQQSALFCHDARPLHATADMRLRNCGAVSDAFSGFVSAWHRSSTESVIDYAAIDRTTQRPDPAELLPALDRLVKARSA